MVAWPALLLTAPAILNSLAPLADPLRAAANKIPGFSGKKTGDPAMQPDISSIHWSKMTFKTVAGPVITQNFPDPSIIEVNGTYYAFATNNKGEKDSMIHIQVATSTDFKKWAVTGEDALPTVGAWSVGHRVWAPDVVQLHDGTFIMYYSAEVFGHTRFHCVGAATSSDILGPYKPLDTALACPLAEGGAIDPDGFFDNSTNKYYVTYKVDGNSIGHGGNCNNGIEPRVPTPIRLQELLPDAVTPAGEPVEILDRDWFDGPLIEAPSLHRSEEGIYFLFFSSNCFVGPLYDTSYATSDNITGPYKKTGRPLYVTGDGPDLMAPGGTDIMKDGSKLVFHGDLKGLGSIRKKGLTRGMYTAEPKFDGHTVSI